MKRLAALAFAAALAASAAYADQMKTRKVSFKSGGETLSGTLYMPEDADAGVKRPGIVVSGAWTSIKEQMSGIYARAMAERGFVALAFDYRGWGESTGTIRFKEDPATKTADITAAVEFMASVPEIDAANMNGLGICASAGYMADAVSANPQIRSLALVAPWLHNPAIVEQVYGGPDGVKSLIATSQTAEEAERKGDAQIIVAASATDRAALMYQVPYYTETDRGLIPEYDNKFNLSSWEPWLTYNSVSIAARIDKPTLLVHSEAAAVPQGAHAFLGLLKVDARSIWLENVSQFDFYDDPENVNIAADAAAEHFTRNSSGTKSEGEMQ